MTDDAGITARIDDLLVLSANLNKTDFAKYLRDCEAVLPSDFGGLGDGVAEALVADGALGGTEQAWRGAADRAGAQAAADPVAGAFRANLPRRGPHLRRRRRSAGSHSAGDGRGRRDDGRGVGVDPRREDGGVNPARRAELPLKLTRSSHL